MSLADTYARVPAHLRQFVVEQDYSAYDEIDQAVWRFTMIQAFNQLKDSAHPTYIKGLEQTGLSLERIPSIEEMNEKLSQFGWGAVGVIGFIPPRAFQEFQALGILAVNTPIRTWDHLAYTPAPDIIHEAAGHAPIIPDPVYSDFLKRFGRLGRKAFAAKEDFAVYEAIRQLSDLKENPAATAKQLQAADDHLLHAIDSVTYTSEATFLTRLHWWTVEYGLIGKPDNYKSYGAGILSSVSESIMLHLPEVKKLRLRARCVETDYDITEQQPQLFVAESFEQLNDVLDQVTADFSFNVGGRLALQRFLASGEVGTVHLNSGLQISGRLTRIIGAGDYLQFTGPCALATDNKHLPGHDTSAHKEGYGTPLGRLTDGTALSSLSEYDLGRYQYRGPGSRIMLSFKSGVLVEGCLERILTNDEGHLMLLSFRDCKVTLGDQLLFDPAWGTYDMAIGEMVPTAYSGVADESYWPATEFSGMTSPKKKTYSTKDKSMLKLFQKTTAACQNDNLDKGLQQLNTIGQDLISHYPDQWLLSWNILEHLTRVDRGLTLAAQLKTFMLGIEAKRPKDIPVTMGLKSLGLA